ncbi:hypothetical protein BD310DRAFT_969937 [Dichomitus squalens]|uniref:BTB domain-containing protein n=1 Tax=Dichomitus squalens TaxID=114155 RepID=A0A4Q9PJE0_9APHY|nr:hypothetical protein BD310DRAFT_969937 [Dichomitus squalens]
MPRSMLASYRPHMGQSVQSSQSSSPVLVEHSASPALPTTPQSSVITILPPAQPNAALGIYGSASSSGAAIFADSRIGRNRTPVEVDYGRDVVEPDIENASAYGPPPVIRAPELHSFPPSPPLQPTNPMTLPPGSTPDRGSSPPPILPASRTSSPSIHSYSPNVTTRDLAASFDSPHRRDCNRYNYCPVPYTYYSPEEVTYLRDGEHWYEDGNVELLAEGVQFRVYQQPLVEQSLILRELWEKARARGYSGPRVIHLSETSPEDVRHVLKFLYGGTACVEPSFEEVSAHIRFGHQYKTEKLLKRSLDYLKKFYVTRLEAWVQLPSIDPPLFQPIHAIGVVKLARLLGVDGAELLPIALMRCCTLGAEIVEGYICEDGAQVTLSSEDLGRCFVGRTRLLEASILATDKLRTHMVQDECKRPQRCKATLQRFVNELLDSNNADGQLVSELRCLRWDLSSIGCR